MNGRMKAAAFATSLLILIAAACDFSPSAPFAGFEPDQQQGATLTGRVQQMGASGASRQTTAGFSGQQALSASSSAEEPVPTTVVVYVGGLEIGSVDIEDGAFTIRGLPERFTLVFLDQNGDPIGDPTGMYFDGVKPNQEIDIVVGLEGGDVVLLEESRTGIDHDGSSGIEIEGTAENVVIIGPSPVTGELDVNQHHILTRAGETSIRKGQERLTLEDIDGKQVHVRGVFEGDDVFAFEIKLQDEEEEDPDDGSAPSCTVQDPAKPNHILICHKGRTLSVSPNAWPGHFGHGDKCGPC